jgi:hypothetical protein
MLQERPKQDLVSGQAEQRRDDHAGNQCKGRVEPQHRTYAIGDVAAKHDDLPVRHIEHTHGAVNEVQAEGYQSVKGTERESCDEKLNIQNRVHRDVPVPRSDSIAPKRPWA